MFYQHFFSKKNNSNTIVNNFYNLSKMPKLLYVFVLLFVLVSQILCCASAHEKQISETFRLNETYSYTSFFFSDCTDSICHDECSVKKLPLMECFLGGETMSFMGDCDGEKMTIYTYQEIDCLGPAHIDVYDTQKCIDLGTHYVKYQCV